MYLLISGSSPSGPPLSRFVDNLPPWQPVNQSLDDSQRRAIALALSAKDIALIHGPPGEACLPCASYYKAVHPSCSILSTQPSADPESLSCGSRSLQACQIDPVGSRPTLSMPCYSSDVQCMRPYPYISFIIHTFTVSHLFLMSHTLSLTPHITLICTDRTQCQRILRTFMEPLVPPYDVWFK